MPDVNFIDNILKQNRCAFSRPEEHRYAYRLAIGGRDCADYKRMSGTVRARYITSHYAEAGHETTITGTCNSIRPTNWPPLI